MKFQKQIWWNLHLARAIAQIISMGGGEMNAHTHIHRHTHTHPLYTIGEFNWRKQEENLLFRQMIWVGK